MSKSRKTILLSATLLLSTGSGAMADDSYGDTILLKLESGLANIGTGLAEVPKNVINTTNQTNVLFGTTGGVIKGTAHALGRTLGGILDTFTFFVPTKPIANPPFVWENFYTDTQYGPVLKVESKEAKKNTGAEKRY
jgi:putative exosortase-associated protein (TIGR04073 family)